MQFFKDRAVNKRLLERKYHELALKEIHSGKRRPDLMAQAIANSKANPAGVEGEYLSLLVTALKDEDYIVSCVEEEGNKAVRRVARQREQQEQQEQQEAQDRKVALKATLAKLSGEPQGWDKVLNFVVIGAFVLGVGYQYWRTHRPAPEPLPPAVSYAPPAAPVASVAPVSAPELQQPVTRVNTRAEEPASAQRSRAQSQPACQYKTIMSDADYRACGLTPPNR
ncbi:TPA: hypothetical protein L6A81_12130 [Pseudomonas aeruginosa]|nr:hypothetical protein [Pseudomonas aeruginosa]